MKILIVGAGVVGINLAEELSKEGHEVSIVDSSAEQTRFVSDRMDVLAVHGHGTSHRVLKDAGVERAEMAIAVTDVDETNLVISMLAHKFGVKRKIARIRSHEYAMKDSLLRPGDFFVDRVINPEEIVVDTIEKIVETPGATSIASFADGKILLRGFTVPSNAPIIGKRLAEMREIAEMDTFLIVALSREGKLMIPKGDTEIRTDDHIFVVVSRETLPLFLPLLNRRVDEVETIVIYGATRVGTSLASRLESKVKQITVIEPDEEKARSAAETLSSAVILHGEGTDLDLLKEAQAGRADIFMALSDSDQSNLLSSLLAKRLGGKKLLAIATEPEYVSVLNSVDIDIVLNPRLLTVGEILQYVRRGRIHAVAKLAEGQAEVIELDTIPGSKVVDKPLREVDFPPGAIVAAILRNGQMVIPNGSSIIRAGDSVVVLAVSEAIPKIEKLFARQQFLGL
ncbi:MAG: Trk system potassium transporter TrkA [Planctomycetota bacterium]|nr:Trk system potassium transporter TrkA [Planctomycetota bacterium]